MDQRGILKLRHEPDRLVHFGQFLDARHDNLHDPVFQKAYCIPVDSDLPQERESQKPNNLLRIENEIKFLAQFEQGVELLELPIQTAIRDRKSTRLNSSHSQISYA